MRAAAALEVRFLGRVADHRDAAHTLERQNAVILEQDHPFPGDLARQGMMAGHVKRGAFGCLCSFEDDVQDATNGLIKHGLVKLAVPHGLHHRLNTTLPGARHFQVQAAPNGGDPVMHRAPVGDDKSLEAPLILKNFRQQLVMLRAVDAVNPVIATHHGPGLRLLDGGLEGRQVNLTQGALVHLRADGHALVFLIIGRVVFERCADPLALHPVDEAGRQLPGQVGILREVLKVAAAGRRPLHVGAWTQHHVHVQGDSLLGQRLAQLAEQIRVPRRRRARCSREAGRRQSVYRHRVLIRDAPHAVRPVRNEQLWYTQAFHRRGGPGSGPGAQRGLFFKGHLCDDRANVHHEWVILQSKGYAYESYTDRTLRASRERASVHPAGSGHDTVTVRPAGRSK